MASSVGFGSGAVCAAVRPLMRLRGDEHRAIFGRAITLIPSLTAPKTRQEASPN
jgi:hypothetical protein